jgi:hypothetical protein
MKGECRDVKNGCFSLFYRAVFCLVFIEEKISRRKKRCCLHGDSIFHLGEIVWERLPKSESRDIQAGHRRALFRGEYRFA